METTSTRFPRIDPLVALIGLVGLILMSGCTNTETRAFPAEPGECVYSEDCPIGTFCESGCCRVYDGCLTDAECGPSSLCMCDGLCYELDCSNSIECPGGTLCSNGFCSSASPAQSSCTSSADCGCGEYCGENQCKAGCQMDADCCGNGFCQEGECVADPPPISCKDGEECPSGTTCNESTQLCEDLCITTQDCPGGSSCAANGLCYAVCSSTQLCTGEGVYCDTDGFCKQGTLCLTDADCSGPEFCSADGICTIPLSEDPS